VKCVERDVAAPAVGLTQREMETESAAELVADNPHPLERERVEQRD
jgi:hypothetical protein